MAFTLSQKQLLCCICETCCGAEYKSSHASYRTVPFCFFFLIFISMVPLTKMNHHRKSEVSRDICYSSNKEVVILTQSWSGTCNVFWCADATYGSLQAPVIHAHTDTQTWKKNLEQNFHDTNMYYTWIYDTYQHDWPVSMHVGARTLTRGSIKAAARR